MQWDSDKGLNGWGVDFINILRGIKAELPSISEDVGAFFELIDSDDISLSELDVNGIKDLTVDLGVADESLIKFLQDTNYATKDLANYELYLKNSGKATSTFATMTKKAGTMIKSLVANMASMAVMWLVGEAIGFATKKISEHIHANERYLEQQDEIIQKANDTISKAESRISSLESLQKQLEATNGSQAEMYELSEQINDVLGEGSSQILNQANAYDLLNANLERQIQLEKERQDVANQEVRKAEWEKAKNFTLNETSGIDEELTMSDIMGKRVSVLTQAGDGGISYAKEEYTDTTIQSIFDEVLQQYLDAGKELTIDSLTKLLNTSINKFNLDSINDIEISTEEIKSSLQDGLNSLHTAFSDIINNGEGFLTPADKQAILDQLFLLEGGDINDKWKEDTRNLLTLLDSHGDEVNNALTEYSSKLKNSIDGDEDVIYDQLVALFDGFKTDNPEIANLIDNYFNHMIAKLEDGAEEFRQNAVNTIFADEEFSGIYNKLLSYFVADGSMNTTALEEVFGKNIINALEKACEEAGIEFEYLLQHLLNRSEDLVDRFAPNHNQAINSKSDYDAYYEDHAKADYYSNLDEETQTLIINAVVPEDVKNGTLQDFKTWVGELQTEADANVVKVITDIDFTTNKETIDDYQSSLNTLGDTYAKVITDNNSGSDMVDILQTLNEEGAG